MTRRPLAPAMALGVVVGVLVGAAVLAVVALPLLFFARAVDPAQALDRPLVRVGLLGFALPLGGFTAVVAAVATAAWYRRGGWLPREEPGPLGG